MATSYTTTHVLIDSRDRKAGTPSEYYVALQPKIRNVVKLKFNTFNGGAFPYTFRDDIRYAVRVAWRTTGSSVWTFSDTEILIPKGMYNLPELVALLNTNFYQLRMRIDYSEIDHKVTISKCEYYYNSGNTYEYTAQSAEGRNTLVDTLIGFPRGWAVSSAQNILGCRSSYAVQKEFLPNTLMIAFSNYPSKVVSSSGVIGELAVPYTSRTFDFQSNRITWSENQMFNSEIHTYAEYIDHLGIRIVDSRTGEKYLYMEEHIIQVEITHADTMDAKPFPAKDLNLLE